MLKILKSYSYLYELVQEIVDDEPLSIQEANLVGGRASGKSVSAEVMLAEICQRLKNLPKKIGIICVRYSDKGALEYFDELCEVFNLNEIDFKKNKGEKKIQVGNVLIRVIGCNSLDTKSKAQKAGLANFVGVKYIIRIFEEVYEFPKKVLLALKEAIRGISVDPEHPEKNNIQMLDLQICNPWAANHYYISYCKQYQNWDVNQLRTKGEQIGIYEVKLGDGYTKRVLFHYTNWRVAKNVLSQDKISSILDTWNFDKKRALTVDYGLPGYEESAIYTHLMGNIGNAVYQEHEWIAGGLDWGWGTNEHSSKTVCYFMGASIETGIDIYGEYVSSNREYQRNTDIVIQEIVTFYQRQMEEYCSRIGVFTPYNLKVRCDYMNVGIISLLNAKAREMRVSHWLSFVKCSKEFKTDDRIDLTLGIMSKQLLRVTPKIKELLANMESAYYEDIETRKRAKKNDDGLNAFEYGFEPFIKKISKYHLNNMNISNMWRK